MKPIIHLSSAIFIACAMPLAGQVTKSVETTQTDGRAVTKTTETTEVTRGGGKVTEKTTTTTRVLDPDARQNVVTYFRQFTGNRHGLPPGIVTKARVRDIPMEWRTASIANGIIIEDKLRPYLFAAPDELVDVLPEPTEGVRYYVAGTNLIAVDESYRIVDSIQIPSIRYREDEDAIVIEKEEEGKSTRVEVDKASGDVVVDEAEEE